MPGNDDFCTCPDDFLMNNAIIAPPYEGVPAGVYYFSIEHAGFDMSTFETIPLKTTADSIAWQLKLHRGRPDGRAIKAYWCPYIPNDTGVITLGSQATYMFTAGLTGCSFGFGNPSSDGALRVAHANSQEEDKNSQSEAQAKQLVSKNIIQSYSPKEYRTDSDGQSTIFGIRGIIHWRIFAHKFKLNTPMLEDLGVKRIYG